MTALSLDIVEIVVDHLSSDDPNLLSTKSCSLVCKDFLAICRKRIFASIVLNNTYVTPPSPNFEWIQSGTTLSFQRLLSETPELGEHIRDLQYTCTRNDLENVELVQTFKKVTRLQSLAISRERQARARWNDNSLRPALLHLLHLPTLTDFELISMDGFGVSDLMPCINLERLGFCYASTLAEPPSILPTSPIRLRKIESVGRNCSMTLVDICAAQCQNGEPFMDFSNLADITIEMADSAAFEALGRLLSRCNQLTSVHLGVDQIESDLPALTGLSVMLVPSMRTLKHLEVATTFEGFGLDDPICGIVNELERMSNKNVIETISIKVSQNINADCSRANEWGQLDNILGNSGWPQLRQVSLTISILTFGPVNERLMEALQRLPETQLPRLYSKKVLSLQVLVNP